MTNKYKINKPLDYTKSEEYAKKINTQFNAQYFAKSGKPLELSKKMRVKANTNYNADQIHGWLKDPIRNSNNLVNVSKYFFNSNALYKWTITTVANMATYNWTLTYDNKKKKAPNKVKEFYVEASRYTDKLNLPHILRDVFQTALIEDWYFAYQMETDDNFFLYKFDQVYCQPSSVNPDGSYNFALDFSYFKDKEDVLSSYPKELQRKYLQYKNTNERWIQIDPQYGFCLKLNQGFLYTLPYYAVLFPSLMDLEYYKNLKKDRAENEIFQLFHQKIPLDEKDFNKFAIDPSLAREFHSQLVGAIPDNAGVATTPMDVSSVTVSNNARADGDYVNQSYRDLFTDSGLPQSLSNTEGASSVGLNKAITVIEQIVFGFYRQLEVILNRKLAYKYPKESIKLRFLDITSFNRAEKSEELLKSAQNGINIMHYASSVGSNPHEFLNNLELETTVFDLVNKLQPIKTSYTLSSEDSGRPSQGDSVEPSTDTNRDADTDDNKIASQ